MKTIKSINRYLKRAAMVVSIDFYRLIDKVDNVQIEIVDSYRFIERFSDIGFYRLNTSGFIGFATNVIVVNFMMK